MKVKTSKQIKKELERYSDFANAYSDAIEALEAWETGKMTLRPRRKLSKIEVLQLFGVSTRKSQSPTKS